MLLRPNSVAPLCVNGEGPNKRYSVAPYPYPYPYPYPHPYPYPYP